MWPFDLGKWLQSNLFIQQNIKMTFYKIDETSATVLKKKSKLVLFEPYGMEFPIIFVASRRYLWISGASSFIYW